MGINLVLGAVIVSPVVFIVVTVRFASEEWLQAFAAVARSLWRPI